MVKNQPAFVLGDFNQILTSDEHYSINPYTLPVIGMEEFQERLNNSELADIEARGTLFTWGNGRPEDPILRNLDKVLGNEQWRNQFSDIVAYFDSPGDCDHSPCLVDLNVNVRSRKCSFKYFSFLDMHPNFLDSVKSAWDEEIPVRLKLYSLGQKLSHVKKSCRKLNKEGFSNIQHRAKETLTKLQEV